METVPFGRTGLKVSRLCFGTMGVGSSAWKPWVLDEADSMPLLKRCLDLGITFFDMADWYSTGASERHRGQDLAVDGAAGGARFHHQGQVPDER